MTKTYHGGTSGSAATPLLALALAVAPCAARAQQDEAPAPSASPAPSSGRTIDFRLPPQNDGRSAGVQGPADNGLPPLAPGERRGLPAPTPTPAPTPAPAPPPVAPRVVPTQPAQDPAPAPAPDRRAPPSAVQAPAAVPAAGQAGSTPATPTPQAATAGAPAEPEIPTDDSPPPVAGPESPPAAPERSGPPLWAWALALIAAAGAALWYWRRRPALAGDAPDEAAGAPPPAPAPAAPTPAAPRTTVPAPPPAAAPRAASPLVTRPSAERRAQVSMTLGVHVIRVTGDSLAVGFSLELRNDGPLAATGLMVRIALGQGSAMQEAVLARFFDGAGGSVLRDGMDLAPGAREMLNSEVTLPLRAIEPLMIGGRPMLVPVLVFDVTYHWHGDADAFGQTAGTYVLGRAPAEGTGDKLAPLALDRGAYLVDRPAARSTAARRTL